MEDEDDYEACMQVGFLMDDDEYSCISFEADNGCPTIVAMLIGRNETIEKVAFCLTLTELTAFINSLTDLRAMINARNIECKKRKES